METEYPPDPEPSYPEPAFPEPSQAQWQDPPRDINHETYRSVTPAMNNRRNPSPAHFRGSSPSGAARMEAHYGGRTPSPAKYVDDGFDAPKPESTQPEEAGPSSTGLIRLELRKPMGIVFEPMYDPNAPSVQRGVRICDLPRTGAAALSRKLEVGDELLSINDKTMSRLTFDEIMDFIIEADPENVNLLFRRPRKEMLEARQDAKSSNDDRVKWVDGDDRKDKKKSSRRSRARDDDDTLQSEDYEREYRRSRRYRRKHSPYETESFLDILIDTICANPDSVCRDGRRRVGDDDTYYSEDDDTFASRDDSTYVTYESEDTRERKLEKIKRKKAREQESDSEVEETRKSKSRDKKKYEDDVTLETVESQDRAKPSPMEPVPDAVPPLGLVPNPEPTQGNLPADDDTNPAAPLRAVEFDGDADVGADVSVMESLGGPSLMLEKQRQAQILASKADTTPPVPPEISDVYGLDYPLDFGFTREQTISNDPLRFYTFVVKGLLQEHEPEKVRLLDKLLAKYRGREDHLVQKLSVRYTTEEPAPEKFEEAVVKTKGSAYSMENVELARERMQSSFQQSEWPVKESKEPEPEDEAPVDEEEEYAENEIDGTSPAVIAQVSELLNYVYGKTSVPGQIDRVSTIMRAYEGREAVLLELLETKALIKANRDKENAGNLPSFLKGKTDAVVDDDVPVDSPVKSKPSEEISSMSSPTQPVEAAPKPVPVVNTKAKSEGVPSSTRSPATQQSKDKKKKKGIFGMFKKDKKEKKRSTSNGRSLRSSNARSIKNQASI